MDDESDLLGISWHDSAWIPGLNPGNIMDYFSRSKFYDRTCNNEVIKMQRQSLDRLVHMTGIEYVLFRAQPPILYIIRRQHRHNPENVTPVAYYYIIAGIIYQAPDLCTVLNSRLLNTTFNLNTALNKAVRSARYHPSKGYWWEFKEEKSKEETENKQEQASWFQRNRVDILLGELVKQYPMKVALVPTVPLPAESDQKTDKTDSKPGEKRALNDAEQPDAKQPRIIKSEAT